MELIKKKHWIYYDFKLAVFCFFVFVYTGYMKQVENRWVTVECQYSNNVANFVLKMSINDGYRI